MNSCPDDTGGRRGWVWPALIGIAVLIAYGNSLRGVMLFDDVRSIAENPRMQRFPDVVIGSSRPLTELTFHLNYRCGGLGVAGYHAVNTGIHLVNAWLLFGVVVLGLRLLPLRPSRARVAGGITALLWAVHPLQTESVSYIVQRAESLMGLFALATVGLMLKRRLARCPERWGAAAIAACACGMLTKPVMAGVPFVVLCVDAALARRSWRATWRADRAFYVPLFLTLLIPGLLLALPNESSTSAGLADGMLSPPAYLLTQCRVVGRYLRLAVAPWPLCLDYGWPAATWREALLPGAALVLLLIVTVRLHWRRSPWSIPGCWFFLMLAPSSSVIPLADVAAEHRMYLPLAAPLLLLALGVTRWLDDCPAPWEREPDTRPGALRRRMACCAGGALITAAVVGSIWGTRLRNADYRSAEGMWRRVLAVAPTNRRAHLGLGASLLRRGAGDAAEAHLQRALAGIPREALGRPGPMATLYSLALNNLGVVRVRQARFAEAETCFREAFDVARGNIQAAVNLASLLHHRGAYNEAEAVLQDVLRRREPGHAGIRALLETMRQAPRAAQTNAAATGSRVSDP
jgi:protein O-mannosyl-transferase